MWLQSSRGYSHIIENGSHYSSFQVFIVFHAPQPGWNVRLGHKPPQPAPPLTIPCLTNSVFPTVVSTETGHTLGLVYSSLALVKTPIPTTPWPTTAINFMATNWQSPIHGNPERVQSMIYLLSIRLASFCSMMMNCVVPLVSLGTCKSLYCIG